MVSLTELFFWSHVYAAAYLRTGSYATGLTLWLQSYKADQFQKNPSRHSFNVKTIYSNLVVSFCFPGTYLGQVHAQEIPVLICIVLSSYNFKHEQAELISNTNLLAS